MYNKKATLQFMWININYKGQLTAKEEKKV